MAASLGLRCGSTTIKYLLFAFNLLFLLLGLVVLVIAAIPLGRASALGGVLSAALILAVVVGSVILIISFLGCFGAIKESPCMLVAFAGCLILILILEIVVVSLSFANSGYSMSKSLQKIFLTARDQQDSTALSIVADLQQAFSCCGYNGPGFWLTGSSSFPSSCCSSSASTCDYTTAFAASCGETIGNTFHTYLVGVGAVGIVIVVIEVLGIWLALGLAGAIRGLEKGVQTTS